MKRYLYLAALLIASPSYANSINTTSNSTGSVTNQAVQVVPARQFSYSVGPSIQCQGATLNISPFLSTTYGFGSPYEPSYNKPVYDLSDNNGLTDADGNAIGDGIPDNPGRILYYEQTRTGMRASNTSINGGITATFSIPLDGTAVRLCKESMEKQVALYDASLAAKRLNYEMSRAATCAKHMKEGIVFVGELSKICADIRLVTPPNTLIEHRHEVPVSSKAVPSTPSVSSSYPRPKATWPSPSTWRLERGSFSR